jgi:hypothetical protein
MAVRKLMKNHKPVHFLASIAIPVEKIIATCLRLVEGLLFKA